MRNLICAIMWIVWLAATIVLIFTFVGIIVVLDGDDWMSIGRNFANGVTRD